MSYTHERTFPKLIGPLGRKRGRLPCECMFVDPIADVAVLGAPEVGEAQWDAYYELIEASGALQLEVLNDDAETDVWIPALTEDWVSCLARLYPRALVLKNLPSRSIAPGMSGSPIVTAAGAAVGVISISSGGPTYAVSLQQSLPAWMVRGLTS